MRLIFFMLMIALSINVQAQTKQLSLEDFVTNSTFRPATIDGINSMNDGLHFTSLVDGKQIVQYHYKTGEQVAVLFDLNMLKDKPINSISAYTFSNDEQRILLESNKKSIYRHSYTANFHVWDQYTQTLYSVSDYGPQQVASLSPDGERIAFVRDNNIYIKTLRFGTELQVTADGEKNKIINGVPDWVYEEEFSFNKALEWSPDSKQLAYIKFDESEVTEFSFPLYKGEMPEKTDYQLYPGEYTYKYPKAGQANAKVSVHVYDVKTRTTLAMNTGSTDYIPKITWTPTGNDLAIFRLNRFQNELDLLYANPYTGDIRTIINEKNKRYIDEQFLAQFTYLDDGEHFVVMSERDGWSHLYLYKNTGFMVKQITSGKFDVTDFYGYDHKNKLFYYQAAKKSPLQREVYAVSFDGKKESNLSAKAGTNKALFSNSFLYFLNYFSSHQQPLTVTVHDAKGKQLRVLEDNQALRDKLAEYQITSREFISFNNSEGFELNGYLIKPSNFDPNRKYPVVMTQYSGPNSQEVLDEWLFDWHSYLASQGYLIACFDPRGTAARGEDFRKASYLQLGKLEADDQVEAAKYLASLPYTDGNKIAIWGWSYGGFITALSLNKGGEVFRAGVAVAPVTNWRFYDTVYTERFMRTPQQNPDGYDDNSPINNVDQIKGRLLLIHGTADDNVHVQNTHEYAEALVQAGIPFDMQVYTNRNHSIYGGKTRLHLFRQIIHHFDTYLK
ncbi:MAG: S9 family peptidase [Prolixibacteraceae bacterium]|nr:S9 family peptidase [Prolixibacteraceae bacterium]